MNEEHAEAEMTDVTGWTREQFEAFLEAAIEDAQKTMDAYAPKPSK